MRRASLKRHIVDQHFPTQCTSCYMCGKVFKNSKSLNSHMNVIHRQYKTIVKSTSAVWCTVLGALAFRVLYCSILLHCVDLTFGIICLCATLVGIPLYWQYLRNFILQTTWRWPPIGAETCREKSTLNCAQTFVAYGGFYTYWYIYIYLYSLHVLAYLAVFRYTNWFLHFRSLQGNCYWCELFYYYFFLFPRCRFLLT
jgi:uncharacterized C2H2 Zn-finger protein